MMIVNVKKTTAASTLVAGAAGATAMGAQTVATTATAVAATAASTTAAKIIAWATPLAYGAAVATGEKYIAVHTAAAAATSTAVPVAIAVGAFAIFGGVVVGGLYFNSEKYHANAKFVTPKTMKTVEVLKGWLMDFHTPDMRYNLYDNNCQHVAKAIFHVVTEVDYDSDSD